MTRAQSGKAVLRKRKRMRRLTKGFRQGRHHQYRQAKVTLIRARVYAFRDRRERKREFRRLWIIRINAACRQLGLRYSRFIAGLQRAQVELNRKILADLAVHDPRTFALLVKVARASLPRVMRDALWKKPSDELWAELQNREGGSMDRIKRLHEMVKRRDRRLPEFIISELESCRKSKDQWVGALVRAASETHFANPEQRARVRVHLLRIAGDLRASADGTQEVVLWTALRRYSSLMPISEAGELSAFLDARNSARTRQATLQCVQFLFHNRPLMDEPVPLKLRNQIGELARHCFVPSMPEEGLPSSLALNALLALAALGDATLTDLATTIKSQAEPWFVSLLSRRLQGMIDEWNKEILRLPAPPPAVKVVKEAISILAANPPTASNAS